MKVKTLIQKLEHMNPEADVRLNDYDGDTALFLNSRVTDDTVVWLDGESDFDLSEELQARYDNASDNNIDELDFYMDLLEIGITVKMIEKYMDKEHANNMKVFCEEHGLL